uniref:Uncharacterized protein n=1 Tax=Chlorobium chlorochromatii (strain CaD3) TaxID=340177 RepID=Q3ASD3_CHLCH
MESNGFFPFRSELLKASIGLATTITETSEQPIFDELKIRRYNVPADEIASFILTKLDHWFGWNMLSDRPSKNNTRLIRADVGSILLFGLKIKVTYGLYEEKDANERPITSVHAHAETSIESKGDLGESRRVIRMMLSALDFNYLTEQLHDEEYQSRSLDCAATRYILEQMFVVEPEPEPAKPAPSKVPKATVIELRKPNPVQTIPLITKPKSNEADVVALLEPMETEQPAANVAALEEETYQSSATSAAGDDKPAKPKIIVVTSKKNQ